MSDRRETTKSNRLIGAALRQTEDHDSSWGEATMSTTFNSQGFCTQRFFAAMYRMAS